MKEVDTNDIQKFIDKTVDEALKSTTCLFVPPPDFNEKQYLLDNPDVRDAVEIGHFKSGYHHYMANGRKEGRARPNLLGETKL
jgi:hypothetical protein